MTTAPQQPVFFEIGTRLRKYLYFTAAMTGAAVMIVEILGAKMLAPYFGTSHFVWTAQIVMTLLALSCGYYLGGRLADGARNLTPLYTCILVAALFLCASPLVAHWLAFQCLSLPLAAGSLLVSLALFFPPLTLLAVTAPFLVRVLSSSLATVGGQTGRLSAVSTLGSVAGTLLIGYVVIPYLPNSTIMLITGGSLAALGAVYFFVWGRKSGGRDLAAVGLVTALVAGIAGMMRDANSAIPGAQQVYRANSNFGELRVMKTGAGHLVYLNDFLTQGGYDPARQQSIFKFTYMLHGLACAYHPKPERVLCIGTGLGAVPMEFADEGARVDAVEINPAAVVMAEKYFGLDASKVAIHIADGRQWLNAAGADARFDAIILDAFLGDSNPWHLTTRESFQTMRHAMIPGGVLVINAFCKFEPGKDFYAASLYKTLKSVFKSVRIHHSGASLNTYYVASDTEDLEIRAEPDFSKVHPDCRTEVEEAFRERQDDYDFASGIMLTDDYNPAEYYDAPNREGFRKQVAALMKDL